MTQPLDALAIALFPQIATPRFKALAREALDFFSQREVEVFVEDDKAEALDSPPLSLADPTTIHFLIAMGGDGSILRIVHNYAELNAAILGINLGHLGFMADVQIEEMIPSLEDLLDGKYSLQNRYAIEGTFKEQSFFAINDCVFHRASNPSLIELALYVDSRHGNTFEADGIIVATPNGSTAYSLAAGGPILSPEIEALLLTPICPHTISHRPIVLAPNREIRIEYVSHKDPIEVSADGIHRFALKTGESISLRKSAKSFQLIHLDRIDYFSTLRRKLGWSGNLRKAT